MQRGGPSGFSAIELAILISVVATLAVVAIGTMDLSAGALDGAVRRIESDLRFAQQTAMTEETPCGFVTTGLQSYQVYRQAPGTPLTDPHTQTAMTIDLQQRYRGVTFGGNYQVTFQPSGLPTGASVNITVRQGARSKTIRVTALSGMIQVQ